MAPSAVGAAAFETSSLRERSEDTELVSQVARRKKALTNSFERFDKTAFYIKTKQSQQLTSNLQEAAGFKQERGNLLGCKMLWQMGTSR
eukprot:s13543_g1.t1